MLEYLEIHGSHRVKWCLESDSWWKTLFFAQIGALKSFQSVSGMLHVVSTFHALSLVVSLLIFWIAVRCCVPFPSQTCFHLKSTCHTWSFFYGCSSSCVAVGCLIQKSVQIELQRTCLSFWHPSCEIWPSSLNIVWIKSLPSWEEPLRKPSWFWMKSSPNSSEKTWVSRSLCPTLVWGLGYFRVVQFLSWC